MKLRTIQIAELRCAVRQQTISSPLSHELKIHVELSRCRRPSVLSFTWRKSNLSSSSTASSSSSSSWTKGGSALPTKKEDVTKSFKLFVKQSQAKSTKTSHLTLPTSTPLPLRGSGYRLKHFNDWPFTNKQSKHPPLWWDYEAP